MNVLDKRPFSAYHLLGTLLLGGIFLLSGGCAWLLRNTSRPRADLGAWHLSRMEVDSFSDLTHQGLGPEVASVFAKDLRHLLGSRISLVHRPTDGVLVGRIYGQGVTRNRQAWLAMTISLWSPSPARLLWIHHLDELVPVLPDETPRHRLDRTIGLAAKEFARDFVAP